MVIRKYYKNLWITAKMDGSLSTRELLRLFWLKGKEDWNDKKFDWIIDIRRNKIAFNNAKENLRKLATNLGMDNSSYQGWDFLTTYDQTKGIKMEDQKDPKQIAQEAVDKLK